MWDFSLRSKWQTLNSFSEVSLNELKKNDASCVGIFGSFARNEMREESDIDVLVEFNGRISLLELVGLELDLSEQIGRKVDLITRGAVYPKLWTYIEKDLKVPYQWKKITTQQ